MRSLWRKHRAAIAALIVYNFVVFFPVVFMGRVLSPNDVFYNFSPWMSLRTAAGAQTQNSLLNDPPTAYFTLMSLVRDDWRVFHWNPYVASGIPGFGSSASAVLSPFILLPLFTVPLAWVYTAIVFLKLNASFLLGYLWLRQERLGRNGAAIGAAVIAGAGAYSVRWLWQITNATALYPALLWIVRRTLDGRRVSIVFAALVTLAYGVSGFPAAMAYGAWVVVGYAFVSAVAMTRSAAARERLRRAIRAAARPAAGVAIGVLLAIPTIVPFVQFLGRSGYLEMRKDASAKLVYPLSHFESFLRPERLGNQAHKNWSGDPRLGVLNNYVEATVYMGLLPLPLALAGLFSRRARARWFWLGIAAVALAAMFGAPVIGSLMARLPGLKFSALTRLALVLPLPVAYLAASARLRKRFVYLACAAVTAFDLGLLAGRFHPYLEWGDADVPPTAMTDYLRSQPGPFRVAPFFNYLWPNSSELVRLEDVRSHFGSEGAYRRMMLRIDPTSFGGAGTVITFNSLKYNFNDPLNGLLGIRWFVEHKDIDIIKWSIFAATVPGVKGSESPLPLRPGDSYYRTVTVDAEPFWSIELPVRIEEARGAVPRVEVELLKAGTVVWSRAFNKEEANLMEKLYVPLRPYARLGETVAIRVRSVGVRGSLAKSEVRAPGEDPLFYGRVAIPIIFDRELPDGRLFRNVGELPRFRPVSRIRKMNDDEFLAARDVDFSTEAVITDDPVMPPDLAASSGARVTLLHYAPDRQILATSASGPFFLASSEKLTPELAVTVDGQDVSPVEVDLLFAGVAVPAGRHEVVFSRRIARGWWWVGGVGALLFAVAVAIEMRAGAMSAIGRQKAEGRRQS